MVDTYRTPNHTHTSRHSSMNTHLTRIRAASHVRHGTDVESVRAFHRALSDVTRPHDTLTVSLGQHEAWIAIDDMGALFTCVQELLAHPLVGSVGLFRGELQTFVSPLSRQLEFCGALVTAAQTTAHPEGVRAYGDAAFEHERGIHSVWSARSEARALGAGLFALLLSADEEAPRAHAEVQRTLEEWCGMCRNTKLGATTELDTSGIDLVVNHRDALFDRLNDEAEAFPNQVAEALADIGTSGVSLSVLPRFEESLDRVLGYSDALQPATYCQLLLLKLRLPGTQAPPERIALMDTLNRWFEANPDAPPRHSIVFLIQRAYQALSGGRHERINGLLDEASELARRHELAVYANLTISIRYLLGEFPAEWKGAPQRALHDLEEALSQAYALGHAALVMRLEHSLALWALFHDVGRAKHHLNESIRLSKRLYQHDTRRLEFALMELLLGNVSTVLDILDEAPPGDRTDQRVSNQLYTQCFLVQGRYDDAMRVLDASEAPSVVDPNAKLELDTTRFALAACQKRRSARPEHDDPPPYIVTVTEFFELLYDMRVGGASAERVEQAKSLIDTFNVMETWRSTCRLVAQRLFPEAFLDAEDDTTLVLHEDAGVYVCGGQRFDVSSRANFRNILHAFVENHAREQRYMSTVELFERGWPEQTNVPMSFANRVYVALAHLRNHGLKPFIERNKEGYRLRPTTRLLFHDEI